MVVAEQNCSKMQTRGIAKSMPIDDCRVSKDSNRSTPSEGLSFSIDRDSFGDKSPQLAGTVVVVRTTK
jgi:hypothetical protein